MGGSVAEVLLGIQADAKPLVVHRNVHAALQGDAEFIAHLHAGRAKCAGGCARLFVDDEEQAGADAGVWTDRTFADVIFHGQRRWKDQYVIDQFGTGQCARSAGMVLGKTADRLDRYVGGGEIFDGQCGYDIVIDLGLATRWKANAIVFDLRYLSIGQYSRSKCLYLPLSIMCSGKSRGGEHYRSRRCGE